MIPLEAAFRYRDYQLKNQNSVPGGGEISGYTDETTPDQEIADELIQNAS